MVNHRGKWGGVLLFGVCFLTPAAGAQRSWEVCYCPGDRVAQCLAVNAHGHMLAGTLDGGVFVSTDGARSWSTRNAGLEGLAVLAAAVCADGEFLIGTLGKGVFASPDNGSTWRPIGCDLGSREVTALAVTPGGIAYAATTESGLYRCNGGTGEWISAGLRGIYVNALAVTPQGVLIAATSGKGLAVTRDQGRSWMFAVGNLAGKEVWDVVVDTRGRIFAATNGQGVYRSEDQGTTWVPVNDGLDEPYIGSLAVLPTGDLIAGTARGMYRTHDAGEWWSYAGADLDAVTHVVSDHRSTVFAATTGGTMMRRSSTATAR
jgi:ligand-binding sensor domain-containing protein